MGFNSAFKVLTLFSNFLTFLKHKVLGTFGKPRRAAFSFFMSVCSSVHPHGTLRSHWTGFHNTRYLSIFRKSFELTQVSLQSGKNNGYFKWNQNIFLIYLSTLIIMRNVSDRSCGENRNTFYVQ
jgi:hypothetical protein